MQCQVENEFSPAMRRAHPRIVGGPGCLPWHRHPALGLGQAIDMGKMSMLLAPLTKTKHAGRAARRVFQKRLKRKKGLASGCCSALASAGASVAGAAGSVAARRVPWQARRFRGRRGGLGDGATASVAGMVASAAGATASAAGVSVFSAFWTSRVCHVSCSQDLPRRRARSRPSRRSHRCGAARVCRCAYSHRCVWRTGGLLVEEKRDGILVAHLAQGCGGDGWHPSSRRQPRPSWPCDHFLNERTQGAGFREGGLNPAVTDERGGQVGEQSGAMFAGDAERLVMFKMAHGVRKCQVPRGKYQDLPRDTGIVF